MTKFEGFSVNFRDVMIVSGSYANQATKRALICLRYFPLVLLNMMYKVFLTFESVDEPQAVMRILLT